MPGIRVNNPVGPDWEYSLDTTTWQPDPVFTELAAGVPLVVGTVYPVYCRNLPLDQTALASIRFGQATNEDDLDDVAARSLIPSLAVANIESIPALYQTTVGGGLSVGRLFVAGMLEWLTSNINPNDAGRIAAALASLIDLDYVLSGGKNVSDEGMALTGNGSYSFVRRLNTPGTQPQGMPWSEEQPDGSYTQPASIFYDRDRGLLELSRNGKKQVEIGDSTVRINTDLTARSVSLAVLPSALSASYVMVPVVSPLDPNEWQLQALSMKALIDMILKADAPGLAAGLKAYLQDVDLTDNVWVASKVCNPVESTETGERTQQIITLPNLTNGQTAPHLMATSQIWVSAQNQPSVTVDITSATLVTFSVPEGVVVPSFTFKLEPLNA